MSTKHTLALRLRPGCAALTGVVSVLHSRAAEVEELTYAVHRGEASLRFCTWMTDQQAARLALQLDRRVDVFDVHVRNVA